MKKRGAFFYILIVLALLAVGALIYFLAPGNEPETPAVLLPPAASPEVSGGESTGGAALQETIAVTPETVQTVIGTLSRADSYSRTLTAETYWSGGKRTETLDVWARGGSYRITVHGDPLKNVLLSGREKWVWYSDGPEVFRGTVRDGDADAYQTLLTYEDVLALPAEQITDAGYTDYADTSCVFVRYTDGAFNYDHCCYIAVDTGLLMGQESYDGDTLVYAMRSTVPDISTPDEALFQPPSGN